MTPKTVTCPACHGGGTYHEGGIYIPPGGFWEDCDLCIGKGRITQKLRMQWVRCHKKTFGINFKSQN